jgi:hypothetical protein
MVTCAICWINCTLTNERLVRIITRRTRIDVNYIYKFSLYRAVNTLRLGYKNQSVNAV